LDDIFFIFSKFGNKKRRAIATTLCLDGDFVGSFLGSAVDSFLAIEADEEIRISIFDFDVDESVSRQLIVINSNQGGSECTIIE
jgi:hypothetical protein